MTAVDAALRRLLFDVAEGLPSTVTALSAALETLLDEGDDCTLAEVREAIHAFLVATNWLTHIARDAEGQLYGIWNDTFSSLAPNLGDLALVDQAEPGGDT